MADRPDLRPVQVFLDTRKFIEIPPTQPRPRAGKDFFQDYPITLTEEINK